MTVSFVGGVVTSNNPIATTLTQSLTCSGTNRAVFAFAREASGAGPPASAVVSVSYNGTALTRIQDRVGSGNRHASSFGSTNFEPSSGANNVFWVFTAPSAVVTSQIALSDVDQTTRYTATAFSGADSGTSISTAITVASGGMAIDYVWTNQSAGLTTGGSQMAVGSNFGPESGTTALANCSYLAGATAMSWTQGASAQYVHLVIAVNPAGGGGGTLVGAISGNAVADGVTAGLSRAIIVAPGNAVADGTQAVLNRAALATPGIAAADGVIATLSQSNGTAVSCTPGSAVAAGVQAAAQGTTAISCQPGNAVADGMPARIGFASIDPGWLGGSVDRRKKRHAWDYQPSAEEVRRQRVALGIEPAPATARMPVAPATKRVIRAAAKRALAPEMSDSQAQAGLQQEMERQHITHRQRYVALMLRQRDEMRSRAVASALARQLAQDDELAARLLLLC